MPKFEQKRNGKTWCLFCGEMKKRMHDQSHIDLIAELLEEYQKFQNKVFSQMWSEISKDYQESNKSVNNKN